MQKRHSIHIRVLSAVIVLLAIVLSFLYFLNSSAKRITQENISYSLELTSSKADLVEEIMHDNVSCIKLTAYLYGTSLKSPTVDLELLKNMESNMGFDWIRFISADGTDYASNGQVANCADREYFQDGMKGGTGVTQVIKSRINGNPLIGYYAPVYYNNSIIGIVIGFDNQSKIDALLESELFGYKCNTWLCMANGYILSDVGDGSINNVDEIMSDSDMLKKIGEDYETVAFRFDDGNGKAIGHAVHIGGTDMFICQTLPASVTNSMINNNRNTGIHLLAMLMIIYLLFIAFLIIYSHRKNVTLQKQAERDGLTGLYNVPNIHRKLDELIEEKKNPTLMVGFVDIDNFKNFNSKYGHSGGDKVILYVAECLKRIFGENVGRNGGDEFLVWSDTMTDTEAIKLNFDKLIHEFNSGLYMESIGDNVATPCSIGISIKSKYKLDKNTIISDADAAMYEVKNSSKNSYMIHTIS